MQLMRPDARLVDSRYLEHYLRFFHLSGGTESLQTATTNIRNLKTKDYLETPVTLPPRAEQERIVAAIEERLSRLDTAMACLNRADAAAGVLLSTARATIDREDWPRRQLREVAEAQLGKMLSAKSRTGIGSTPYLRNRNVRWGSVDVSDVAFMDFTNAEREKFRLVSGDVLICEGGAGVGRTAVWRDEIEICCYQKALHRVRVSDLLLPEFLATYLQHFVESRQMEKHLSGVAIGHFPQEDLRALPVPVPNVAVQRDWLVWFEAQSDLVEHGRAAMFASRARSSSLRRSILDAAFHGQLVPHDPDDEPAAVLIERIRAERAAAAQVSRSRRAKA
jgi:type I restriction enzyme S subunit